MAFLQQLLQSLGPLAQQDTAYRNDQHMNKVFAANPEFATRLYGAQNDQARVGVDQQQLALQQKEYQRKLAQQEALKNLAQQYASQSGSASPLENLISQASVLTGDISPLASLAVEKEKQAAEAKRQSALASIFSGSPVPSQGGQNPLSIRNNNPGNIRDTQSGAFRQFSTPEEGLAAMANDLTAKITGNSPAMKARFGEGYQPTLTNVISTWAPPTENDTQNYIDTVARETGLAPDQVLSPMDIQKLIPAMAKMEGGQQAADYFQQSQQQTPAPQQETNPVLQQLRQAAQLDPEKYGPAYLQAQLDDVQNDAKRIDEARKAEKEASKNLTEGERDLRKEFEGLPDVKSFREVEGAYKRISKAATNPSAAGDIALIFNYMKMLDPGSTVREGEFATAQNAAGVPVMIQNQWNKLQNGERLAPAQRADFLSQAKQQYIGAEELFNSRASQYETLASEYEFEPDRIVQRARSDGATPDTQAAVDPSLLQYMTPEERALFQ